MSDPQSRTAMALTVENERLRAELRSRLEELAECRQRAVDAAEATRRRIERNLHDGMQQRLVSVAMALGLVDAKLPNEPEVAKPIASNARKALAAAMAELRELSQDLYPNVLAERGLAAALEDLCERAAVPCRLTISLDETPSAQAAATTYFTVSEALTNVAKHAHATAARVVVRCADGVLTVHVRDDGKGGAATHGGTGLRGLVDRVEALGGRLTVSSPPGRGTTVRAEIPSRSGDAGRLPSAAYPPDGPCYGFRATPLHQPPGEIDVPTTGDRRPSQTVTSPDSRTAGMTGPRPHQAWT
jgi:signal transduction histidine kinase